MKKYYCSKCGETFKADNPDACPSCDSSQIYTTSVVGVTDFDQALAQQLRGMIDQLAAIRVGMYRSGHGCSCDETGLCALHADVHSSLVEAADNLARAISKAQSEG